MRISVSTRENFLLSSHFLAALTPLFRSYDVLAVQRAASKTGSPEIKVIESFTQFSRKLLNLSAQEANKLGHNMVDSEHMLIAISRQDSSLASTLLSGRGLGTQAIIEEVLRKNPKGSFSGTVFSYSEDLRAILSS